MATVMGAVSMTGVSALLGSAPAVSQHPGAGSYHMRKPSSGGRYYRDADTDMARCITGLPGGAESDAFGEAYFDANGRRSRRERRTASRTARRIARRSIVVA